MLSLKPILPALCITLLLIGCRKDDFRQCPQDLAIVTEFTSPEGLQGVVYADGNLYLNENGICRFISQYYPLDWMDRYLVTDSAVYIVMDDGELFPTDNDFVEDFSSYADFLDLFPQSIADTALHWTSFTLQSPLAKTVADYVDLRQCILNQTCTFRDHRIDLSPDPVQPGNQTLRFSTVDPSGDMITGKSSISSDLTYFGKGSDCWFEARFYIESGMPYSLVDLENGQFYQGPGPRVVLRNGALAMENKFGEKLTYTQENPIPVPMQSWFTVKFHLHLSEGADGTVSLWQDGQLLLSDSGPTLPTFNSIQDNCEIGISASGEATVLYVDDVRISDEPF